jgi:hypothetical protein
MVVSSDHDSKPSGSIQGREFIDYAREFDYLSSFQLLKDSALVS